MKYIKAVINSLLMAPFVFILASIPFCALLTKSMAWDRGTQRNEWVFKDILDIFTVWIPNKLRFPRKK